MQNSLLEEQNTSIKVLTKYLKPYLWHLMATVFCLIIVSGSVLAMGKGMRIVLDQGITQANAARLDEAFWLLMMVVCFLALASYGRVLLTHHIGEHMAADIRSDVYKRMISMHIGFFETMRTGDLLSRLSSDTNILQHVVGNVAAVFVRNILIFIGGIAMMLITNLHLTALVGLVVPLVVIPIIVVGRRLKLEALKASRLLASVSSQAEESINAIRTVQAFVLEDYENKIFQQRVVAARKAALERVRLRGFMGGLVIFLVFGAIAVVLRFGGLDVIEGGITLGELSAFIFYAMLVAATSNSLSEAWMDIQRALGAGSRIAELLVMTPAIVSATPLEAKMSEALHPSSEIGVNVTFDQVSFTYPTRPEKPAIHDFSLSVNPGETIALVGPSGAGKTTIFQLLMRFYDPTSGLITVNGLDIKDVSLAELRGLIGIVPQDPVIFSASARENIRLGNITASDEQVIEAARVASALDFIEKLPQGLDSHLGQKGVQLSGGQRQRIAIARAVVRNPRLLLLDEATSALDSENEHAIQQALEKLVKGRTTFIIAHRLSTITNADRIILMNEGRIEAVGTHRELLEKSPLYGRLAELQFKMAI